MEFSSDDGKILQNAYQLALHPFFESWTDPVSGVESFILTQRVAPLQQTFYFTNPSVSADGKWLWFYCSFPPNPQRTLGVVSLDPTNPVIKHFPAAGFTSASPMVAPQGEEPGCYFALGASVWLQPLEGEPRIICTLNDKYIAGRRLTRLATHLTVSADGKYFLLDGEIGNHWFIAVGDRATGEVRVIKEFPNNHNHAQFSTIDPNLFLLAHDHTHDPITGRRLHFDTRIWLMDVNNSRYEPLTPFRYCKPYDGIAHEWWASDGSVCYVDYEKGVFRVDPKGGDHQFVWKRPLCHAHCDASGRYWCADDSPYKWKERPCEVLTFDAATLEVTQIVSGMPAPRLGRDGYHIDPHPQFSPDGQWIVYTTTVRNAGADVAVSRSPRQS